MSRLRITSKEGDWEVSVERHTNAPTFTFDIFAPAAHMTEPVEGQRVISCHNMTRAELEEHVRHCEAALARVPAPDSIESVSNDVFISQRRGG